MSEMIVQVRNKILRRIGGVNHFVSHNKDYTIQFQFDESWDNVRTKMAVFAYEDGEYGSEIFDGDTCNVPELPREGRILIGVKAGEDLSTELLCIPVCKSADDVITDEYDEPDPKIYEQILDIINNLWNGGTTVYPSPVKFLASPSAAKVGDLIRVKEVDENGDVTRTEGFDVGVELDRKIDAPQTAAVGEVLTVEEVGEDGKPKKWKTQKVETAPPDWMENVSNNPGFVKNRTHYKQMINGSIGNPGYKVNLLDGTHRVGDIILLQSVTTNILQKSLMRGINSPDWDIYELCMLIKETDNNDKTYNLEVICKDRENIVEVNTLSEGNIKVLYSEQKKAFLAYYFISDLSTLSTDDQTKFTQTGVYVQLVGKDYSEYAELWATYRLYLYTKLSNKYLNIRQDPPDWNENDPTKPGYIKNRPFYKSDENPLGTLTFTATATNELAYTVTEMGIDTIGGIYNITKIDVGGGVPKGQLRVVVSGQSYLTEVESNRGHFGFSGSGISGHGYYRTGDATIIAIDDGSMSLTVGEFYDVSFFDINSSGYVKIPTEYFSKEVFTQNSAPVKYGDGNQSTIQGDSTKATGYSSHAEGNGTKALERSSHAEGSYTTASGETSHAEGSYTTASGNTSHAEGYCTEAFGSSSHAEGDHTVASNKNMHTSGKYNVIEPRYKIYYRTGNYFFNKNAEYYCSDTYTLNQKTGKFTLNNAIKKIFTQCMGKYVSMDSVSENVDGVFKVLSTSSGSTANYYPCNYYYSKTLANDIGTYSHIIGNGTSDTERSNAYTLDWEGNAWFAGNVYVGSTSGTNKDDGSKKLLDTSDLLAFAEEVKDVTIQKPTTAQVGQIIKVKAVDESGKITETETVDMPNRLDVTVSMGDNGFVVSHKFAEIKAAYDAGRAVQLINIDTSMKYSLMDFFPGNIEGVTYADFKFIDGAGNIWIAKIDSNNEIDFFQDGTFVTLYGDVPQNTPKAITYSTANGIGYADFIPYIEIPSMGDDLKEYLAIGPAYFYVMPNAYAPFALKNLVNPYTLTRLSYSEPEFGTENNTFEASYLVTDSLGQQIKATCQVLLTESGLGDLAWNFEVRDSLIVKSSTDGSSKKFKITVDDSGIISAAEITN